MSNIGEDGRMTPNQDVNITMNPRPESEILKERYGDDSVTKEQVELRYKRFREQLATVQGLIKILFTSVNRLESENQSLRDQNEYYQSQRKNSGERTTDSVKSPTAASIALGLLQKTVGRMQERVANFEGIGLADKEMAEETQRQYDQIKRELEEANRNLRAEKKKRERLEEKCTFLENEFVKEVTVRLATEKRFYSLETQVKDLSDELSAQSSQMLVRNAQQLSSDSEHEHSAVSNEHSAVSNEHAASSTPHSRPVRTNTGTSNHESSNSVRSAPWKRTATFTSRFQSVFSDVEDRFRKLKCKVKTFADVFNNQDLFSEHTKHLFGWTLHKAVDSRSITEN